MSEQMATFSFTDKKVRNVQTGRQNSLGDLPKTSLCMRETDVSTKRIGQNLFSCQALEKKIDTTFMFVWLILYVATAMGEMS